MKTVFLILLAVHGLLHGLGFLKAFTKKITGLSPVSRTAGIAWLIAAAGILAYAVLYALDHPYQWLAGCCAAWLSQLLILSMWKEARFGTFVNLLILFISWMSYGQYLLWNEFSGCVRSDFSTNSFRSQDVLTENDIRHLPAIVQKYLHYTQSLGKPKVTNFKAEFQGNMYAKPGALPMSIKSVQYNFYKNPSRYFYITAHQMGLPVTGLHLYRNESATFRINLMNWISLVDARGEKMNQAETVTLLNDMCLIAPPVLIDRRITWKVVNDSIVQAFFTNGKYRVSAELSFKRNGELIVFSSNDRYDTDGKTYRQYPWITPVEGYRMMNGYLLPAKAKLIYHKKGGDFTYGELSYEQVQYNLNRMED